MTTSTSSKRKIRRRASRRRPDDAALRQRRVQVDDVGHARSRRGCRRRAGRSRCRRSRGSRRPCADAGPRRAGRGTPGTRRRRRSRRRSAAITASSRRKPRPAAPRITNAATPVRRAAGKSGMPNSRLMPIAAPRNSAMSVAIAITSACTHSPNVTPAREAVAADLGQVAARSRSRASRSSTGSASPSGSPRATTHSSR